MSLHEMQQNVTEAEQTLRNADVIASRLARILKGRLRHVDRWMLQELKRELKSFNAVTCEWKEGS